MCIHKYKILKNVAVFVSSTILNHSQSAWVGGHMVMVLRHNFLRLWRLSQWWNLSYHSLWRFLPWIVILCHWSKHSKTFCSSLNDWRFNMLVYWLAGKMVYEYVFRLVVIFIHYRVLKIVASFQSTLEIGKIDASQSSWLCDCQLYKSTIDKEISSSSAWKPKQALGNSPP